MCRLRANGVRREASSKRSLRPNALLWKRALLTRGARHFATARLSFCPLLLPIAALTKGGHAQRDRQQNSRCDRTRPGLARVHVLGPPAEPTQIRLRRFLIRINIGLHLQIVQ
jgi:hypothetical protein